MRLYVSVCERESCKVKIDQHEPKSTQVIKVNDTRPKSTPLVIKVNQRNQRV